MLPSLEYYRQEPSTRCVSDIVKGPALRQYMMGDPNKSFIGEIVHFAQHHDVLLLFTAHFRAVPNAGTELEEGPTSLATYGSAVPPGRNGSINDHLGELSLNTPARKRVDFAPSSGSGFHAPTADTSFASATSHDTSGFYAQQEHEAEEQKEQSSTATSLGQGTQLTSSSTVGAPEVPPDEVTELRLALSLLQAKLNAMAGASSDGPARTPRTSRTSQRTPVSSFGPLEFHTPQQAPTSQRESPSITSYGHANSSVSDLLLKGLLNKYPYFFDVEADQLESPAWRKVRLASWDKITASLPRHMVTPYYVGDLKGIMDLVLKHGKLSIVELRFKARANLQNFRKQTCFGLFLAKLGALTSDFETHSRPSTDEESMTQLRFCLVDSQNYLDEMRTECRLQPSITYPEMLQRLTIFAVHIHDMDPPARRPPRPFVNNVDIPQEEKKVCWNMRDRGECKRENCPFDHSTTGEIRAKNRQRGRGDRGRGRNRGDRGGRGRSGRDSGRDQGAPEKCWHFEANGVCETPNCRYGHFYADGTQAN
jgi:hypothetical protein